MASSLEAVAFATALYALGGLGFLGVTLLPFRSWLLVRRYSWALRSAMEQRCCYLALVAAAIAATTFAGTSLVHAARCLLGYHCSANAAGGWIAMAGIGFWYAAFEVAAFLARLALKPQGSQPNNSSKPTPLRGAA